MEQQQELYESDRHNTEQGQMRQKKIFINGCDHFLISLSRKKGSCRGFHENSQRGENKLAFTKEALKI